MAIFETLAKDFKVNKYVYIMALPVFLFYLLFHYVPMTGIIISFMDYNPAKGMLGSKWIGMDNYIAFFTNFQFLRLLRNTVLLSIYEILWGFPAPIILALAINELSAKYFKRIVQTVSYMPHFISLVVICGLVLNFTSAEGIINQISVLFGGEQVSYLLKSEYFRTIFVSTTIWQESGWKSIIYLSAISAIDPAMYEAAIIDGAGRIKQLVYVTLPCLVPTIVILLILRIGNIMTLGFEKVLLLYNPNIYETADIISTYVYRSGLLNMNYSFSTAVGMFNSVINCIFLVSANKISSKLTENSLW